MSTKFTASLPDGRIAKRTSASRTYTHVIAVAPTVAWERANLEETIARCEHILETQPSRRDSTAKYLGEKRHELANLEGRADDEPGNWFALGWAGSEALAQARVTGSEARRWAFAQAIAVHA